MGVKRKAHTRASAGLMDVIAFTPSVGNNETEVQIADPFEVIVTCGSHLDQPPRYLPCLTWRLKITYRSAGKGLLKGS